MTLLRKSVKSDHGNFGKGQTPTTRAAAKLNFAIRQAAGTKGNIQALQASIAGGLIENMNVSVFESSSALELLYHEIDIILKAADTIETALRSISNSSSYNNSSKHVPKSK